jgi:hypothetical protein
MKIKIAVEARIDARDRRRCLTTCWWYEDLTYKRWCDLHATEIGADSRGRPLRCRECIAREVKP